jgi:hypothetical protein
VASIVASDLVAYAAVNMPTDSVSTVGGAIDATIRCDFTQLAANDTIYAKSTSASDTGNITVIGRNAGGTVVSQTAAIGGTTGINLATLGTVERVLSAVMAAAAVGTVTVGRGTTGTPGPNVRTIPPGEKGFKAIIQQIASSTSAPVNCYAKFFWKNTNGANALLGAQVVENADPTGLVTHALETSVGGSNTAANRVTAPGTVTAFGNVAVTLAAATGTADLASGSAIGVWLLLALATNNAAIRSTYTSEIDGSTT